MPDVTQWGISNDTPALVANPSPTVYTNGVLDPTLGAAYAATLPEDCPFIAISLETVPPFDSPSSLSNADLRVAGLNRIRALFQEMRRVRPSLEFYLEPFPIFAGYLDYRNSAWRTSWEVYDSFLRTPFAGAPRGAYSIFDGVFVNLYRRYADDASVPNYMIDFANHSIEAAKTSRLPIHCYMSPREAFAFTNYVGATVSASQRLITPDLFLPIFDIALRNGKTVTIWDSKFYGTAQTNPSSNGSLAGNWGTNGVSQADYPGQTGTAAGYGLSANWVSWTAVQTTEWWKAMLWMLKTRGYY